MKIAIYSWSIKRARCRHALHQRKRHPDRRTLAQDVHTGREYLRVSQDNSGRQRSVMEQHDDNERMTARHSIVITGAPYVDNDRSASRYASKARDDWARQKGDAMRGASVFPEGWGPPVGRPLSEERTRWVLARVQEHRARVRVQRRVEVERVKAETFERQRYLLLTRER